MNRISQSLIHLRLQVQSSVNRMLNTAGIRDGGNNNQSYQQRIMNYLQRIFGNRLKYFVFLLFIFLFCLYALAVQSYEELMWNPVVVPPSNNTDTSSIFDRKSQSFNHTGNSTSIYHKSKSDGTFSLWLSVGISIISWLALIQVLRYIRNASYNSASQQRQRDQLRFLTQLSRANIPGLSTRVRLALLQRDFTGDDYEMLQQLDDVRFNGGPVVSQGASEGSIQRLPLHTLSAADFQPRSDGSHVGNCNICLAPYEIGDEVRTVICLHKFHKECIDPWLRTKNICPICKYPATESTE